MSETTDKLDQIVTMLQRYKLEDLALEQKCNELLTELYNTFALRPTPHPVIPLDCEQRTCRSASNKSYYYLHQKGRRDISSLARSTLDDLEYHQGLRIKVSKWVNLMLGSVLGHSREFQAAARYRGKQWREVAFDRADVTVSFGGDGALSKAIQFKSTIVEDASTVDQMIKKAANQLTGESKKTEKPLAHERRIIDMAIHNGANPWPFGTTEPRGTKSLQEFQNAAAQRIIDAVLDYKQGKTGFNKELKDWMTDVGALELDERTLFATGTNSEFGTKRSSAPMVRVIQEAEMSEDDFYIDERLINAVTVKVRFDPPYSLRPLSQPATLQKALFVVFKQSGTIYCAAQGFVGADGKLVTYAVGL